MAGRLGDGVIGAEPSATLLDQFEKAGGDGRPRYGELTVCWAKSEAAARKTAHQHWPTSALESSLSWELPLPEHFEAAAKPVTEDQVAEVITCGPDPKRHISAVQKYIEAGYDHVCVHQVGPDQEGFMKFYERDVLPKVVAARRRVKAGR